MICIYSQFGTFAALNSKLWAAEKKMSGRVAEWFKAHAWKVCVR